MLGGISHPGQRSVQLPVPTLVSPMLCQLLSLSEKWVWFKGVNGLTLTTSAIVVELKALSAGDTCCHFFSEAPLDVLKFVTRAERR